MANLWVLGMVMAVTAGIISNVGWTLQKYVHMKAQDDLSKIDHRLSSLVPRSAGSAYDGTTRRIHRFVLPAAAGIMGAQSVQFAKMFLEVFKSATVYGNGHEFESLLTWGILLATGLTVLLQVMWMNHALEQFSSFYVVPVFSSCWILFSCAGGVVYFNEFATLTTAQITFFCLGGSLVLWGVYLLSDRAPDEQSIADADDNTACCRCLKAAFCIGEGTRGTSAYRRPAWVFGLSLVVFGSVLDLVSFAVAPMSLIAPLAGTVMISNAAICVLVLGEPATAQDLVGVLFAAGGASLCVVFGNKDHPEFQLDQLVTMFLRPHFMAYFISVLAVVAGFYLTAWKLEQLRIAELEKEHEADAADEEAAAAARTAKGASSGGGGGGGGGADEESKEEDEGRPAAEQEAEAPQDGDGGDEGAGSGAEDSPLLSDGAGGQP